MKRKSSPIPERVHQARVQHRWDLSPQAAIRLQNELRSRVSIQPLELVNIRYVAGVDVGFPRGRETAHAAIAVLTFPSLEVVDAVTAELPTPFPYVPGLLSFREMPVILAALERLAIWPDVFLVDGHGMAHPRRFGLACHLGVLFNWPSVGCAKSILTGTANAPDELRGSSTPLSDHDDIIGLTLRTRDRVRPVYISVGHRADLPTASELALRCGSGYRLPEPIRQAHRLASGK